MLGSLLWEFDRKYLLKARDKTDLKRPHQGASYKLLLLMVQMRYHHSNPFCNNDM